MTEHRTFDDELDKPRDWCEDLLDELASTHGVAFTCDRRGRYRTYVNNERRQFLQEVLGLEDVEYWVCDYCDRFALKENSEDWPYMGTCPDCVDELPENLQVKHG